MPFVPGALENEAGEPVRAFARLDSGERVPVELRVGRSGAVSAVLVAEVQEGIVEDFAPSYRGPVAPPEARSRPFDVNDFGPGEDAMSADTLAVFDMGSRSCRVSLEGTVGELAARAAEALGYDEAMTLMLDGDPIDPATPAEELDREERYELLVAVPE